MKNEKNNNFLMGLGLRIKERRNAMGLSQEEFASICQFDRTYISLVERGKRNLSIQNLKTLAEGLAISLSELLEGL